MRKFLISFASLAIIGAVVAACGELTGPVSPTTPSNVIATLTSPTTVNITWSPSPLNDGVTSYSIYRNGNKIGETVGTETTYTDTGLSPQTTYVYSIASNCFGGVESERSEETEASTVTTIDITAPTVIQTLPSNGAVQVSPSADVNAIFSEPMDPATINVNTFTLRITNGAAVAGTLSYNAQTRRATIVPSAALPNPASFTATVTTGAKDLAGNALASNFTWTFTTRDDTPPTVTATSPANGAVGVAPTAAITITFNEAMDQTTVNASNITLRATTSGTVVTSVVTYNTATRVATLTPSAPLTQNVNYTVIVSNAVKDAGGNGILTYQFSFTTGDLTAPSVVSTIPADLATAVPTNSTVSATFSEPMDPTTINTTTFTVRPTSSGTNLTGTVAYSGVTATFTPSAPLAQGTSYTATITVGAKDAAGNPMGAPKVWTFTTVDTTPPTVSSVLPANNATAVPTNSTVRVTFSEPMDPATITNTNITLKNTVTTAVVTATVTYDPNTRIATLTPSGPLSNSTNYTVTVTTGVKDVSGNPLASQFTSAFTTAAPADNTPPTIVARSPINGATSVAVNTNVTVTFSEPMDPATITTSTITLAPTAGGAAVAATVTLGGGGLIATLDPTGNLLNNTSYTVTVTTGVKDVAGNAIAAQSTSTFTTVLDTTAPGITATSPVNNATNVPLNTVITVTFNEDMDVATITGTTFTLTRTTGAGAPVAVTGSVALDSTKRIASFTPSALLLNNTGYQVTITTGAKDLAGNGLAVNAVFSFTTVP